MEEIIVRVPAGQLLIADGLCPKGCSLMNQDKLLSERPAITCEVRLRGQSGLIHLNPFYGIFDYQSELILRSGDVVELVCPHCGASLMTREPCPICKAHLFSIQLPQGGEIQACPMVGCHNHKLILVDLDALFVRYYRGESRPMM